MTNEYMRTQLISFVNLEKQNETMVSSVGVTCVCAQVTQSRLSLCDPMDYSPPRLLCSWDFPGKNTAVVAISFSRESSRSRD